MTTIAYHSYCNIPFAGGSYTAGPVRGALNTANMPLQMQQHNRGLLNGVCPNPPHFANDAMTASFAHSRAEYRRTRTTEDNFGVGKPVGAPIVAPSSRFVAGLQRAFPLSQTCSYTPPQCASLYLHAKKSAAVGRSSMKTTLPPAAYLGYGKSVVAQDVKAAMRRARSGGCVAPAKSGSVFNSFRGNNSHWGAAAPSKYN